MLLGRRILDIEDQSTSTFGSVSIIVTLDMRQPVLAGDPWACPLLQHTHTHTQTHTSPSYQFGLVTPSLGSHHQACCIWLSHWQHSQASHQMDSIRQWMWSGRETFRNIFRLLTPAMLNALIAHQTSPLRIASFVVHQGFACRAICFFGRNPASAS